MHTYSVMDLREKMPKLVPPISLWIGIFGVIAFAINFYVTPEAFMRPWIVVATALTIFLMFLVAWFPRLAWLGCLVLYGYMMAQPEIGVPALILMTPIIGTVVAYRGYIVAAVLGTLFLWYVGSVDVFYGRYLPVDWLAFALSGLILCLPVAIGYSLYRSGWQQKQLKKQWDTDVKTRRETLGRILHDSVASSLTSLIMRLEAMSMQKSLDDETRQEMVDLAEQARLSMKEVRELLHTLSTDDSPRPHEPAPSVVAQVQLMAGALKEHGFTVKISGNISDLRLTADDLVVLQEVLRELSTNIVKYAEPASTVVINFADTSASVMLKISNVPSTGQHRTLLTSGMGIPALSQVMESMGGSLAIVSSLEQWTTELDIPRECGE